MLNEGRRAPGDDAAYALTSRSAIGAAILKAGRVQARAEYVGARDLPKGFGRFRLFRVEPA